MRIAIGADHRGRQALMAIEQLLAGRGDEVQMLGECTDRACDYPDTAYAVAQAVASGQSDCGVLLCGTGLGMSIAANKVDGIRAALVHDEMTAEISRRHNDANVLCLAADLLSFTVVERIVRVWLETDFDGGRHARRIAKVHAIEQGDVPSSVVETPDAEPDKAPA